MTDEKAFVRVSNQQQLLEFHEKLTSASRKLMKSKNSDYSKESDPFHNFRRHGRHGILVRLDDKLLRLGNLLEKGRFAVEDESVMDTIVDIVNYAIIFAAYAEMEAVK